VRAVIDHYADRAKDPEQARWFDAVTPFRPENFARALGQVGAPLEQKRDVRIGWGRPPEESEFPTETGVVKL